MKYPAKKIIKLENQLGQLNWKAIFWGEIPNLKNDFKNSKSLVTPSKDT